MKKVLTIAAVLVMILALSLTAFAAIDDTDFTPSVVQEGVATEATTPVDTETGEELDVELEVSPADPAEVNEESLVATIQITVAADPTVEEEDVAGTEVIDITVLDEAGKPVDYNQPITFTLAYEKADQVLCIKVQNADGSWSDCSFEVVDGALVISAPHLTPIAIVLLTEEAAAAKNTAPAAPAEPTTPAAPAGPQKSPQTGYNTVLWIVLAAAMVSLAGYCFVSARKKAQE